MCVCSVRKRVGILTRRENCWRPGSSYVPPFRPLFSFKLYIADLLAGVHQLTDRLAKPVIVRKLPVDCGNRILGNE